MKNLIIKITIIFFLSSNTFSQWFQQNSGTTSDFLCVYFIDALNGWIGSNEGKIFKTTDGGESWSLISTNSNQDIVSIYFINKDTGWFVSHTYWGNGEGAIYKSVDGGVSWMQKFNSTIMLESIYFIDENNGWAVGTAYFIGGQNLKTTDGGEIWMINSTFGNPYRPMDVLFINENNGFIVGGEPGRIHKTQDGGQTWIETIDSSISKFLAISFADEVNGIAVGRFRGLSRTEDGGVTWQKLQGGIYGSYKSIVNRFPKSWFIARSINILNTFDNGNKWFPQVKRDAGVFSDMFFINDSIGWVVGFDGLILKTINGGNPIVGEPQVPKLIRPGFGTTSPLPVFFEWEEIEFSAYQIQVATDSLFNDVVIDLRIIDNFIQGGNLNTYKKYFWRVRSENINRYSDWSPVWYFYTGGISGVEEDNVFSEFKLSQNYPNPFNPTTTIKYQIQERGLVLLKVYDVLGNEIATLVNEEKPAGEYEVEFDATGLPSGIYYYRLNASNFVDTKKMVLLR